MQRALVERERQKRDRPERAKSLEKVAPEGAPFSIPDPNISRLILILRNRVLSSRRPA
jgi:hypothetical protein